MRNNDQTRGLRFSVALFVVGLAGLMIILIVYVSAVMSKQNEGTVPGKAVTTNETPPVSAQTMTATAVYTQPAPAVPQETEAALNQFGLSATNVVTIAVSAEAPKPIVIPNPLLKHAVQ